MAPNDFEPETRVIADIDTRKRKFIVAKNDIGFRTAVLKRSDHIGQVLVVDGGAVPV